MVRNLVRLVGGEIRGLHEAAYLLGFFALLSQLLALVRDRLLASSFGAGELLDTYYAAFRIPDIIFVSIASLVSVYILIPFLSERAEKGREEERAFLSSVFTVFTASIGVVSLVLFFFVPALSRIFFPGLADSALFPELVLLTRIMLLQPILLGLSNLFGSVTQTRGRFFIYALSPLLYNLGIIGGVLFLYPLWGVMGLAWGVVFGAFLHLLVQMPFIIRDGYLPRFLFAVDWETVKRVVLISLPRTLALASQHIALLVMIGFASVLAVGSIAVFNFAYNLQSVPLSIIAVSYSVAAFPTLTRLFTNGEREQFLEQIIAAARHIIFWSVPAIVLFIVLRAQIVRVILGAGEFDWTETRLVAAALALFVLSLLAQGLVLLFTRGYYAAGKTAIPLLINTGGALSIVAFVLGLIALFDHVLVFRYFIEILLKVEDIQGTAVLMLPLGYSIAILSTAFVLWRRFEHDFPKAEGSIGRILGRTFFHVGGAAIVMGFASHEFLAILDDFFDINTFMGIFLQGLLAGLGGIIVGITLLVLMQNTELHEISRTLHQKFWKSRVVSPEQESL